MRLFVINLERLPERRRIVEDDLGRFGLDYEIFPAIDGSRGEHEGISRADEAACLRNYGAPLIPGEIATFASHYLLWKRCLEAGEPFTIMEDDVQLAPGFPDALALAAERINEHRYLRLAGLKDRPYRVLETIGESQKLVRFLRGPTGCQCYSVSPAGAAALLAGADRWIEPVDLYVDRFWQHGVESKALMPFEAFEIDHAKLASSIGQRDFRRTGMAKFRRELNRIKDDAARVAYNLTHR